jgi:hypothetical protein
MHNVQLYLMARLDDTVIFIGELIELTIRTSCCQCCDTANHTGPCEETNMNLVQSYLHASQQGINKSMTNSIMLNPAANNISMGKCSCQANIPSCLSDIRTCIVVEGDVVTIAVTALKGTHTANYKTDECPDSGKNNDAAADA